jgi:general secretion pathway protein K
VYLRINDQGFALISVTWLMLILSILAAGMLAFSLTARKSADLLEQSIKKEFIAHSALELFLARYFYDEENQFYRSGTLNVMNYNIDIRVNSENGKFNINRADVSNIALVFAANGVSEGEALSLASAIIDWRDSDDLALVLGSESADYALAGLSYGPRNGPFESVGELQFVQGITRDLYLCVQPLITVSSLVAEVDYNQASPRIRNILQWAYDNSWQDEEWINPVEVDSGNASLGTEETIGGQALEILVSLDDEADTQYRTVIRYKSTSDHSYGRLIPLERVTFYDTQKFCPGQ